MIEGNTARRIVVKAHRWIGLTLGLLWVLQGLTGGFLVFYRDLDRLAVPAPKAGPMASLDAIVRSAKVATGDAVLTRLSLTDSHRDLIEVLYNAPAGEQRALVVDASSARVLRATDAAPRTPFNGQAWRWIYAFHQGLNAGRRGEILIGLSGLMLFATVLGGLWLGWPRRRAWKAAFAVRRWRKLEHRLFGWHRAIGLAAGSALLVSAVTGIYMTFPDQSRALAATIVPMGDGSARGDAGRSAINGIGKAVSPQQALNRALETFPRAQFVRIMLPGPTSPDYVVRLRQPGETPPWLGTTSVSVDAASGRILRVHDPRTAPLIERIFDATLSVHNGEVAGLPGRILVMLSGLALATLYVLGVRAWWDGKKRKAERNARRAQRSPSSAASSV
ncbi:PepSY-associated TM helix domain-containing protein [Sphingomonas oligophenolica]|uniref:PepSY-associated TM helix domain-containing protein n=1 Tax=Sphingomonas oligophenolica TaxID=301154 RepID=A0ABU9Y523_9SPHN